jgi:hypothetical protein
LKQTSKFAEEIGIKILIEPEPELLIETSSELLKGLGIVNSDFI